MQFSDYWNKSHLKYSMGDITYDDWLDKYEEVLARCERDVLDLGCGVGNNTLYLLEKGYAVVSCDYSSVALKKLKQDIVGARTELVDISQPLPYEDGKFDLVVADLSLHYFSDDTTKSIMKEIKRILTDGGVLLARVNSVEDVNYGANQGVKIEDNYYEVNGYNKRFFTKEDAKKYFSIVGHVEIEEREMNRYTKPKKVIEIMVTKN